MGWASRGDRALAVAGGFAALLRAERFDRIVQLFAPPLRAAVSAEALRLAWTAEAAGHGGVRAVGEPVREAGEAEPVRVRTPVTCADGGFAVVTSVGDDGLPHGLRLDPYGGAAWQPPRYARESLFTEREVTLGTGPLAVSGTLSLPRGPGPWPAVVLLSGGGAFDRDGSGGPNKPQGPRLGAGRPAGGRTPLRQADLRTPGPRAVRLHHG